MSLRKLWVLTQALLLGACSEPPDLSACECYDGPECEQDADASIADSHSCGDCWPLYPESCTDCDCDGHLVGDDCDDSDGGVYPGAREYLPAPDWCYDYIDGAKVGWPDGKDNDCDGLIDEGFVEPPQEEILCDDHDEDCDGLIDEGVTNTFFRDNDDDGYGDPDSTHEACAAPPGWVEYAGDCDDSDAAVYPGATEIEDGVDNDCDGEVDETE